MAAPVSRPDSASDVASVRQVAVSALRRSLDGVWADLSAAAREDSAPETVHRLRVATRRTLAAVEVFADTIPARSRDWFVKRLSRLRRAAGEARDLDVLEERLIADPAGFPWDRDHLVAMLSRRRAASRSPIREQRRKLIDADWPGRCERLVAAVGRRRRHRRFTSFARRRFKPMIDGFFTAADHRLRSADELHALRIAGKRLRYALEIFAPAFPPRVRGDCQDALERLQKSLGEYTDHAALADRLAEWAAGNAAGECRNLLLLLHRREQDLAEAARKSFSRWWNRRRRRSLRRTFEKTLCRHPV